MGQKISSLGDVFSWKNGESTRNGESSKNGESSRNSEASVASNDGRSVATDGISVSSNKAPERQPFENIYVASATDPQPSSSSQLLSSQDVICPEHPKCCSALTLVANDNAATDTTETITKNIQNSSKSTSGSKKLNHWVLRFNCSRPKSKSTKCCTTPPESVPETNEVKCVCTRYQRTDDHQPSTDIILDNAQAVEEEQSDDDELMPPQNDTLDFVEGFESYHPFEDENDFILPSFHHMPITLNTDMIEEEYINEDFEDRAYRERAKEIQEGIDPPPGFRPSVLQLLELGWPKRRMESLTPVFNCRAAVSTIAVNDMDDNQIVHTSIDYIHYLVPDLLQITNCSFYWGKMDRYEAEKLLENRPEGTFLLRDSAQEEYLFSVSFRKYGRSLHARIEQWNHLFSFDSRDPGVYASSTVCGLIEHYKDPSCCMFFEPMLTIPFPRKFPFSLQHTCRATICSQISYDDVNQLKLPKLLKSYLKEYHYKQRVRIRQFDLEN